MLTPSLFPATSSPMTRNSGFSPPKNAAPDIPEEFRRLGGLFHQDAALLVDMTDAQAIITYVLDNLDTAIKPALKKSLTKLLLRRRLTDGQLRRLWRSTGADYDFRRLRQFLALVRDAMPD